MGLVGQLKWIMLTARHSGLAVQIAAPEIVWGAFIAIYRTFGGSGRHQVTVA